MNVTIFKRNLILFILKNCYYIYLHVFFFLMCNLCGPWDLNKIESNSYCMVTRYETKNNLVRNVIFHDKLF